MGNRIGLNRKLPHLSQFRTDAIDADRVRLPVELMDELSIQEGDLIYVSDARRWLGGLRSVHLKADTPHQETGVVILHDEAVDRANFSLSSYLLQWRRSSERRQDPLTYRPTCSKSVGV